MNLQTPEIVWLRLSQNEKKKLEYNLDIPLFSYAPKCHHHITIKSHPYNTKYFWNRFNCIKFLFLELVANCRFLKRWIAVFGSGIDFQLFFKIVKS